MNPLTTLYVDQADRERQIAEDLRNRQILSVVEPDPDLTTRSVTATSQPTTAHPRPASLSPRPAGR
jgi:hypothetical protein